MIQKNNIFTVIEGRISDFCTKEFRMSDFVNFIKKENSKRERIKIWYEDIPYNGMFIPPDIDIDGQKTSVFHIVLNNKMDIIEQEFTMAHELSHYLLDSQKEEVFYGKMTEREEKEIEANLLCFMFKFPSAIWKDWWQIISAGKKSDFAYELTNLLLDGFKSQIIVLKRLEGIPLQRPINEDILKENMEEVKKTIEIRERIVSAKYLLEQIFNS